MRPFCGNCNDTGRADIGTVSLGPEGAKHTPMMSDCDACAWHRAHMAAARAGAIEECAKVADLAADVGQAVVAIVTARGTDPVLAKFVSEYGEGVAREIAVEIRALAQGGGR